jgi:hypothetical protein
MDTKTLGFLGVDQFLLPLILGYKSNHFFRPATILFQGTNRSFTNGNEAAGKKKFVGWFCNYYSNTNSDKIICNSFLAAFQAGTIKLITAQKSHLSVFQYRQNVFPKSILF